MTRPQNSVHRVLAVLLASTYLFCAQSPVSAGDPFPPYAAVDLGTLGGPYSVATGINDHGEVVGYSSNGTVERAFIWLPRPAYGLPRGMHDLGSLPGGWSAANAMNNLGQVVGASRTGNLDEDHQLIEHAFLWDPATHLMTDLGDLPGGQDGSEAWDINELGQVVGSSVQDKGLNYYFAFIWLPSAAFGLPSGLSRIEGQAGFQMPNIAYDLNDLGEVVGFSGSDILTESRAFIWLPQANYSISAGFHILPSLEDIPSFAVSINNFGAIVGTYTMLSPYKDHGFIWNEGQRSDVADVDVESTGIAVNASNEVIGTIKVGTRRHSFLWKSGSLALLDELLDLDSTLDVQSLAINGRSQVAGRITGAQQIRAFLFTPVEPDLNSDQIVDAADMSDLLECLAGPDMPFADPCAPADLDGDGDTDLRDCSYFFRMITSP